MRRAALLLTACVSCTDAASGALENQSLGRATGFFAQLTSDQVLCELSGIGDVDLRITMAFGPEKKVAVIATKPIEQKHERVHQLATFAYQTGQSVAAAVDLQRGVSIVDPRLGEESRQSALEQRTSLWFPLVVHRARFEATRLCDTDITGGLTNDCVEVPDSTIEGARLWCSVAPNADPRLSE